MQSNEQYFQEIESIAQLFIKKGIILSKDELFELAIKFSIGQSLQDLILALYDAGDTNNKIVDISSSLQDIAENLNKLK